MMGSLDEAERAVMVIFAQEFPDREYNDWNHDIDAAFATHIINTVGRASRINVKKFIDDLW